MVIVLAIQPALTPVGSPVDVPIPVAPVVVYKILVIEVFKQAIESAMTAITVFSGFTIIVPVAFRLLQPPVKGMV